MEGGEGVFVRWEEGEGEGGQRSRMGEKWGAGVEGKGRSDSQLECM